jgi:hypothetical protein
VYFVFFFKLHLVGDEVHDTVLLWNSEEAYLFANWSRAGYHFTCFQYLFGYIPAFFGANHTYDDTRTSIIVIRVTPDRIDRHVVERNFSDLNGDRGFRVYFPFGETIYGFDGRDPWKWDGAQFVGARLEDPVRAEVANSAPSRQDFQNVNGWSAHHELPAWPARSSIKLDAKPINFFVKTNDSRGELSLDVQLSNETPQSVLRVNRNLHLVSNTEYRTMFEKTSQPR